MNGGGSNEERSAEKLMDDHLKSLGLHRKRIAKDGSCLFRAVAEQVLHCQDLHTKVRAQCVEFLKKNRELYEAFIEGDFEDYLDKLKDPQQWVGEVEISALAVMYRRDFLIYQEPGKSAVNITDNNFTDTVQLCFLNGNHYDSVYPIDHIKNSALCQSILYELLYERVFKVDHSLQGAVQRIPRPSDLLIDDNMDPCGTSDESDLDVGERLRTKNESTAPKHNRGRGRGRHLSERVRRSLNPTLFRNIEYDVWLKTKRAQQRMDYCIAAGMQFAAGDRCQVCLEGSGRSYSATVKEVPPNNGLVTVHIEELGRKQVPLWSLCPPTSDEQNSWSTVINRDKRLSDGHGDWEERGKGRGRGKFIPPSKQHSWPPQAALERQGGVSSNRSLSSAEVVMGLEKEHLANQEELRNVAPVEIHLEDEHSFPALGDDGERRKGAEKRRFQRIKTKSPGDDIRDPLPSAGETPKSSAPPSADYPSPTSASAKPPTDPFPLQASVANMKTLPTCPAPLKNTNALSYASAAGATPTSSPAAAAPTTKLSFTSGAVSPATVFLTPVLPTAAFTPLPNTSSSSSLPHSALANLLPSSFPPKSSPSPPSSSSPTLPTFIAPIAPQPSSLPQCSKPISSLPHSPCPSPSSSSVTSSSSSLTRHAVSVQEDPTKSPHSLTNVGESQTSQNHLPQITSVPQVVSTPHIQPQSQSEVALVQSSHPALETSCYSPSQPRSSVTHPHPHLEPPHPSQIPHSSLSLSASLTPNTQTEDPPSHTVPQLHLPHPQSIPGAVPLQQMSQLYQDPLYPGFPLGEKGDMAPTPPFSSSKLGEDLPHDVNILRFFFNLGIKAYSMPMFSPYIYLLPLQQAHTMHPKLPSPSPFPAPHFPPSNPANRHQDGYPHSQYLPTSASVSPQHEPPPPIEARYPITNPPAHRLPWQQEQMPPHRNPSYPVTYPTPFPVPQILSQGYHQLYPSSMPGHPPSSLGYQTSSGHQGVPRGPIEPHQPPNDPGFSISNSNNKMSAPGLALRNKQGDSLTRSLMLVNPPNNPILVSMPGVNRVPVSMTTMRTSSSPGSPSCCDVISKTSSIDDHSPQGYHSHQSPTITYVSPAFSQVGHSLSGAEQPSVGCNTEDDWAESMGVQRPAFNHRGLRKGHRGGGRGRGGHDPGRGSNRRYGGEMGLSPRLYVQYHRGRGRERGY